MYGKLPVKYAQKRHGEGVLLLESKVAPYQQKEDQTRLFDVKSTKRAFRAYRETM